MTTVPLDGVTVVEAGGLLPVSAAAARLRALGARVIKLEPPAGDPARLLYGGWLHELYGHGKEGRTVDLQTEAGRRAVESILDSADAVLVGYRPKTARQLGLDADAARERWPRLVHCAIVGFPSSGPLADVPAHDLTFLARSGALLEPAGPSAVGGTPRRPAVPVADLAAAAAASEAVLAALVGRARTGEGASVEIVLDDVALSWMAPRLGGAVDDRFGPALDPANDVYACADGLWIAISAIEQRFWSAAASVLGAVGPLPEGASTWSSADRVERRDRLAARIAQLVLLRPSSEWLAAFVDAGVPVDLVLDGGAAAARVGDDLDAWRAVAAPVPFRPER